MHRADIGQVAVVLGIVNAIANHEFIGNIKTTEANRNFDFAARRLIQKRADFQTVGIAGVEQADNFGKRIAGINDVFDQKHILARI